MPPPLPQDAIDRWLERNRTNAESLLAVRQAGGGSEYLLQALKLYPNDPAVLMASLTLDDSAEAKRERIDRLKTASPDNALPYYLSAREHLKQSQPEKAIADLVAASGVNKFDDYTLQAMQAAEELYLASGHSPASAKVLGGSSVLLPHLAQLKGLTTDIMDLRQQYLAAGDVESADHLADYMLRLGNQLVTGEGSRFLINQLVGSAIKQITLNKLDPNQEYEFLNVSVADTKAQVTVFRDKAKQDGKNLEQWLTTADDESVINYFERIKLFGERNAIDWWKDTQ